MSLTRNGKTYNIKGIIPEDGFFIGEFSYPNGDPIILKSGDFISGTKVIPLTLPKLTMNVDPVTDKVKGLAPKNKIMNARVENSYLGVSGNKTKFANASGHYSVDLTTQIDIVAGVMYEVSLMHYNHFSGNFAQKSIQTIPQGYSKKPRNVQ